MSSSAQVRVRFFAAAQASAGTPEVTVEWEKLAADGDSVSTLGVLQRHMLELFPVSASSSTPDLVSVFKQCSFLINGKSTKDPAAVLQPGSLVDVLPPFAGG